MSDFKKNVVSGIGWSFVNQIASQILSLIITIVLVRFVSPEEFGTLGMITVLTGFANAFLNFGFAASLIQKESVTDADLSTVFTVGIGSSVVLYTLFFLGAESIAGFYDKPELTELIRVVALNFLILSFGLVQSSMLIRRLQFKKIALINISSLLLAGVAAISMAVSGYGVWSLVVQSLLFAAISGALFWIMSGVTVRVKFHLASFKEMFNFGGHAAADSVLGYWARNLDNLLIAKFLGDFALGVYSKAYSVMLLPLVNFSQVASKVLFPSFASIQHDKPQIKRIYLRITRIIAFVAFPIMAILWALSENFVYVVFGAAWVAMIPVLEILCWLGIPQSILALNGSIYHSLGRADLAFRIGLFLKLNLAIGIIAGLYFGGLLGLVIGYAIAGAVNFYPSFYFAGRLIDLELKELLQNLSKIIAGTVVAGASAFYFKTAGWVKEVGMAGEFLIVAGLAVTIYILVTTWLKVSVLREIKEEAMQLLNQEETGARR